MNNHRKTERQSRRVRLQDIAQKCGVSVSTVSRALSSGKGVRPDLKAQIVEMAVSQNYAIPSSVAGQKVILAASSAAMIDFVRNQFTTHVMEGLMERAGALGIEVISRSISNREEERKLLDEAENTDDIAGVMFLTLDDQTMLDEARNFSKPIVLVNGDDPFMRLSSVTPCNRSAAHLATDHLLGLGHENILFMMRPGRRTIERRFEGWRDAMTAAGHADLDRFVLEVDDWLPDLADRVLTQVIERGVPQFTAVLAAGDSLAAGAMLALQRAGIAVPEQVSVVGMDDLPQAAFLNPPLTTVHIPMRAIGAAALDLLRDKVVGLDGPPRRVELACHLVVRQSAGPAPSPVPIKR